MEQKQPATPSPLSRLIRLFIICASGLLLTDRAVAQGPDPVFLAKPYLQIGEHPLPGTIEIMWQTPVDKSKWSLEVRESSTAKWIPCDPPNIAVVAPDGHIPRFVYRVQVKGLNPGGSFYYRLNRNGHILFNAIGRTIRPANQPSRFVVFGDIGAATPEAKLIAQQAGLATPDLAVVPGDIIYDRGLVSEYDKKFWPVYNADSLSTLGAPLLRSIPFAAAPGNHDTEERDFDTYPDALAYFLFWSQPLNGPLSKEGGPIFPLLKIKDSSRARFLKGAGPRFPVMTNFSFDYGNVHWLCLDADNYVDWNNKDLLDWVDKDLQSASTATWKFVVFHQPGFNSSKEHFEQQQMRLLSPVFEKGGVDVVFTGHVHNYQRTFPMKFLPDNKGIQLIGGRDGKSLRGRIVNGSWTLDKEFDGSMITKPKGIIYLVTGAGGQDLYNPEQTLDTDSWQKFTAKFISTTHSLTVVDVDGNHIIFRQVSSKGETIDSFEVSK